MNNVFRFCRYEFNWIYRNNRRWLLANISKFCFICSTEGAKASIQITYVGKQSKAILACNGQSAGGLQFEKSEGLFHSLACLGVSGISSTLFIESGRLTISPQYSNVYTTHTQASFQFSPKYFPIVFSCSQMFSVDQDV